MKKFLVRISAKKNGPPYAGMVPAFGGSAIWDDQVFEVEAKSYKKAKVKALALAKKTVFNPKRGYYKWLVHF